MKKIIRIIPLQKMPRDKGFFDYIIDSEMASNLSMGDVIEIPFGRRKLLGLVWSFHGSSDIKNLRELTTINKSFSIPKYQIQLIEWFSNYYYYSPASTFSLLQPVPPKRKHDYDLSIFPAEYKKTSIRNSVKKLAKTIYTSEDRKFLISPNDQKVKQELYLSLCALSLSNKSQILIIFPQIEMMITFYKTLSAMERKETILVTNEIQRTKNKFIAARQKISDGKFKIILGTRSSVFLPLQNCKIIVVDEAHSEDLKQWDQNPRYNVTEVVRQLQKIQKNKIVFSSLTPPVDLAFETKQDDYKYIQLGKQNKFIYNVVNLDNERQKKFTYYSTPLIEKINYFKKQNKKSLLIVNKRGLYGYFGCGDCGWSAQCPKCKMPMIIEEKGQLNCRHCRIESDVYLSCPDCHGTNMKKMGIGLEKVIKDLKQLYNFHCTENFADKRAEIYLSTGQNLPTAIDFSISFLGFVYVDSLVYLADYNSNYKLFNFIKNLTINVGERLEEVLIQTSFTDNIAIESVNKDYQFFYQEELRARKNFDYPPFSTIVKLMYEHHDQAIAEKEAYDLYKKLINKCSELSGDVKVSEPYLYYLNKIRKRYRYQIALIFPKISLKNETAIMTLVPNYWLVDKNPKDLL